MDKITVLLKRLTEKLADLKEDNSLSLLEEIIVACSSHLHNLWVIIVTEESGEQQGEQILYSKITAANDTEFYYQKVSGDSQLLPLSSQLKEKGLFQSNNLPFSVISNNELERIIESNNLHSYLAKGVFYLSEKLVGAVLFCSEDIAYSWQEEEKTLLAILSNLYSEMFSKQQLLHHQLKIEAKLHQEIFANEMNSQLILEAEQELQEATAKLLQSEKLASIGQLVASIAHEINNPLSFISSNLDLLKSHVENLLAIKEYYYHQLSESSLASANDYNEKVNGDYISADIHKLIASCIKGSVRISQIISGLKTFAKPDDEMVAGIDLQLCIEESLSLVWNELKYSCEIKKALQPVPKIYGNHGRLIQVLVNLLLNAKQAIVQQGVISISLSASEDYVVIQVQDNGSGIKREHLKQLFDPFFTTKKDCGGTGLGLSISFGIIQQHHGHINVESTPGNGATFTIKLPIHFNNQED